jgi:hypothetical protein
MAIVQITALTPMITPRVVRIERIRLRRKGLCRYGEQEQDLHPGQNASMQMNLRQTPGPSPAVHRQFISMGRGRRLRT